MTSARAVPPRFSREFGYPQVVGALLAGVVQGVALTAITVLTGLHLLLGEPSLWLGENTQLAEALVLLAAGWGVSFAIARGFAVDRAAWLVSITLAVTTILTALVAFVVAQAAILIGLFSIFLVWNGEATEPLLILSVTTTSLFAVVTGMLLALAVAFALARRGPAVAAAGPPMVLPPGVPLI